ncbi:MAG: hypothetical protein JWQ81_6029 [Amycolatopsis sp.]|uniref:hypothetical protein n=1 Tax=Amycolatopsis sp. TaxID=37632 RepID=UPI002628C6DD|nr:hypothetical protein [Amycolatopsis sp.]MCU1685290.1 hypothetical protein [Amycolatopsis sp.]
MSRLRAVFRQHRHHKAFRIAPPVLAARAREQLDRLLDDVRAPLEQPRSELDEKALADAATNLWRAQRRLVQSGEEPSARSRQTGRYLQTCRDSLSAAGLVLQEHDGDAFHAGRSLEVLVFQEDDTLFAETILQTIRPSLYFEGRLIQMGQVIVGAPTPKNPASPDPAARNPVRNDHA